MRILICLHHLVLGGDTINALEIGCRLRENGHAVTFMAIAEPDARDLGAPLLSLAGERDVEVALFDEPSGLRGRARLVGQLARFVRRRGFDVVHAFGHRDTYYTFCATHGLAGVPLVINDYAMTLTAGLPRRPPLVVGTREVREQAARARRGPAYLVVPPVDERANAPGQADGAAFRTAHAVGSDNVLLVVVSRLARFLKQESLCGVIEAVRLLADPRVRLVIVGDGGARADLQALADKTNAELGRIAVVLPGELADPRPAYAAADVVVGMGHSALRAMAFGKPVVVVGERGFSLPVGPDTMAHFDHHGLYGLGDGGAIAPALAARLRRLIADPPSRERFGAFGRETIERDYGLGAVTRQLETIYQDSCAGRSWWAWWSDAAYVAMHYARAKAHRLRGT